MEKQTIEEAAVKWIRQPKLITEKESFIAGAKWQQERSYSEEEVIKLMDNFRNSHEIDLIKWFNLNKKGL